LPNKKYHVIILGAGVAGLSAAACLQRESKDYVVIEKNDIVGGLATTYMVREGEMEFRTDNGPHLFFYGKGEVSQFIESIIPKEAIIKLKLIERIVISGKMLDFPVIPKQLLKTFGYMFVLNALFDYSRAALKYQLLKRPITSFYDYVEANLGKTLALTTTVNYLEKIFGTSADDIHVDLATQRFNFLSLSKFLKEFLKNLIKLKSFGTNITSSTVKAIYPKGGIGIFSENIEKQIKLSDNPILLNSVITKLKHKEKHFTTATVLIDDIEHEFEMDHIVESIPIGEFLGLMDPSPPESVLKAAANLPYRNQIYLFITLEIPKISNYHSTYFADKEVPFARVTEMKNFDIELCPADKTSLLVEFFCDKNDSIDKLTKQELFDLAFPFLQKYFKLDENDIRNYYQFKLDKAYPVYNLTYKKNLNIVTDYLDTFDNLYYIGRTGRFTYISQPRSIEMGLEVAGKIANKNL
jgi:protoporphyrinogen oxidase